MIDSGNWTNILRLTDTTQDICLWKFYLSGSLQTSSKVKILFYGQSSVVQVEMAKKPSNFIS